MGLHSKFCSLIPRHLSLTSRSSSKVSSICCLLSSCLLLQDASVIFETLAGFFLPLLFPFVCMLRERFQTSCVFWICLLAVLWRAVFAKFLTTFHQVWCGCPFVLQLDVWLCHLLFSCPFFFCVFFILVSSFSFWPGSCETDLDGDREWGVVWVCVCLVSDATFLRAYFRPLAVRMQPRCSCASAVITSSVIPSVFELPMSSKLLHWFSEACVYRFWFVCCASFYK